MGRRVDSNKFAIVGMAPDTRIRSRIRSRIRIQPFRRIPNLNTAFQLSAVPDSVTLNQGCGSGSVSRSGLHPDSMSLWIRIRFFESGSRIRIEGQRNERKNVLSKRSKRIVYLTYNFDLRNCISKLLLWIRIRIGSDSVSGSRLKSIRSQSCFKTM
jgi:hypothetical protein